MYMKNIEQVILPIVRGFFFCAIALQIIFGIVYIGKNFMAVPQFRDTTIYLEMAERLVVDEYTGILYPVFIKICKFITTIPYQIPIYIIQIVAGIGCVYYIVRTWTGRKVFAFICALWINTIPFVAQVHMTVLPHSLAMTCLLFMGFQVLRGSTHYRALTMMEWAKLLCGFVILAQLDRVYLLPGMLFVVWAMFLQLYHATHKALMFGVGVLIGIGMLIVNLAIYEVSQAPGSYGRSQRTLASALFDRVGIVTLNNKYRIYMPQEVFDTFGGDTLDYISRYPHKVQEEFKSKLEDKYEKERMNEVYFELAKLGLRTATKENVVKYATDVVHYAIPLGGYFSWQDGELKGTTGWNYQQFISEAPAFSVCYAKICNYLWGILFGISICGCIIRGIQCRKWHLRMWIPIVGYVLIYAMYFAFGGTDVYDYKKALLPMVMSYVPICFWALQYILKRFE